MLVVVILATACAPQIDLTTAPTSLPATSVPQADMAATATSLPATATMTSFPTATVSPSQMPTSQASETPPALTHPFAGEQAWIAFQRLDSSNRLGVWLVHPDGSDEHQTSPMPVVRVVELSPDGTPGCIFLMATSYSRIRSCSRRLPAGLRMRRSLLE
jgi:hypothetical protein